MNWLFVVGDTDILRDATSASAVFWYRARHSGLRLLVIAGLTLLFLAAGSVLVLGPEGTGVSWLRREWTALPFCMVLAVWVGYCGWSAFKFLPSRNDRVVLSLRRWVRASVDPWEEKLRALSDDELRGKTAEFRRRLAAGETIDQIRPEAYACVREASRRGLLPFDYLQAVEGGARRRRRLMPARFRSASKPVCCSASWRPVASLIWPPPSGKRSRPSWRPSSRGGHL